MRKSIAIAFLLILLGISQASAASLIYFDDFSDGDYTTVSGANGLSWQLVSGGASVTNGFLGVQRGGSFIVTQQEMPSNEYTIDMTVSVTWSNNSSIIFLYKSPQDYYSLSIGNGNRGIYRTMAGQTTKIDDGKYDQLVYIGHKSAAIENYKIYVKNDNSTITIRVGRSGWNNGVDYEFKITDTDLTAVQLFHGGKIGIKDEGTTVSSDKRFSLDKVSVFDAIKFDGRPVPAGNFYVNVSSGNDNNPGTQSLPFKTIQKAAFTAMAGDTVLIVPGTYSEGDIPILYSGAEDAPLTFKALDPQSPPVLDGGSSMATSFNFKYPANPYPNYHEYVVFDGLEIKNYTTNGLAFDVQYASARNNTIQNCIIHGSPNGNGILANSGADGLTIKDSKIYNNYRNGISINGGSDYVIFGNEIYSNQDNGVWVGNGMGKQMTTPVYSVKNVLIKNNHIFDQAAGRPDVHTDNIQYTFTDNIRIENNILELGRGQSNMWTEYDGTVYLINNIFIGADVGINSTRNSYVYNNVFYNARVRYDQWQDVVCYRAVEAIIRNNAIIDTDLVLPNEANWDKPRWPFMKLSNNFFSIAVNDKRLSWLKKGIGNNNIIDSDTGNLSKYFLSAAIPYDFHSAAGSALIDAGGNFSEPAVATDIEGNKRFQGQKIDIGPYEATGAILSYPNETIPEQNYIPDYPGEGIFLEDFEYRYLGSGDLSAKKYDWGLSWQAVSGSPFVDVYSGNSSRTLTSPQGTIQILVVAKDGSSWGNYTVSADFAKAYGNPGIVVLYKDPTNFYQYKINTGEIAKRVNGTDITIGTSALLATPHMDNEMHNYKIKISTNAGALTFKVSKDGGSEVTFTDSNPLTTTGSIGFVRDSGNQFYADNIRLELPGASPTPCSQAQLTGYLSQWKAGTLQMAALMQKIAAWKAGQAC